MMDNVRQTCDSLEYIEDYTLLLYLKGRLHRRTLEALRLRKCNRTVMRWNTPTVRGMVQQVKRLVVVETEEMYKARKDKEAKHRALRPPLVVDHHPASPASDSPQ
ncbi:hypothetical protein FEM48_Zijuj06G0077700 [Ziziphus jujuba var. spinosa]|uniref:Large ribosomal subunit protein uL30m n=1 Tax=Ziziphus jujuba var. spinosa TaxID=714518 RepID=A0A978V819_ZIZJJ|nr:hypothetical protein FEM48_Zijuj06G0077700 [Ziziphus jujuba var. spinosa]